MIMDLSLSNLMNLTAGRPGSPSGEANARKFSQSDYLPSKSADERFREFQLRYGNENLGRSLQDTHGGHNMESQHKEQILQNLRQGYPSGESALRKRILEKEHQKYNSKYQTGKYTADGKRLSKGEDNFEKLKKNYDVEALSREHLEQSYRNLERLRQRDLNQQLEEDPEYDIQEMRKYASAGYRLGQEEEDTDIKHQLRRKSTGYRLRDEDEDEALKIENSFHDDLSLRQRSKDRAAAKRREHMQDLQTSSRQRSGKKGTLVANLSGTRYDAVIQIAERQGFTVTKTDSSLVNLIWNDSFVSTEKIAELKPFQKINHFPGMGEITRKDCLARNIKKVQESHKKEFSFIPETWLPNEHSLLVSHAKELKAKKKPKTFIVKPSNRAQGHGIELYTNPDKIPALDNHIVQEYIDRPFLLDRFKFDLRLYVLITSCDPLRVYLFKDGLVRLSTEKYLPPDEQNLDHKFMHLTNYSVNKKNGEYQRGSSANSGSKRSVQYFLNYVAEKTDKNVGQLWQKISDIIVKTLLIGLPQMYTSYKLCRPGSNIGSDSVCFEILGFDFLLDWNLTPWLIEVNRSPSFGIDERIDAQIKPTLIDDTLKLLNMKPSDKERCMRAQKGQSEKRLHSSTRRTDEISKRKDDLSLNNVDKESSDYVSPVDEDNLAKKTLLALNKAKVIDIVRSTIKEVLNPIWPNDIENVTLYRNFNKIFARMLSNHGQGLWNCFSSK
ncbi:hypothetical protein KUTeg_015814 [Tegillarca granosa]|uniref:Uncharacterized protein n=1 Tax=Tegillarca granosa TaxID=220873 RepID=A0ABQ9EIZ3_TEGGR|nr:hypothetical protein KUTeg_015814 [Tegillarca granosa]